MKNWVEKIEGVWGYKLLSPKAFMCPDIKIVPHGKKYALIYDKKGNLLAKCKRDGTIVINAGYTWDGCTAIGRLLETDGTLLASLLHDFLYQVAEQAFYEELFTQRQADAAFRKYLPCWAKLLYWGGVRCFGWAFYGGNEDSLTIEYK